MRLYEDAEKLIQSKPELQGKHKHDIAAFLMFHPDMGELKGSEVKTLTEKYGNPNAVSMFDDDGNEIKTYAAQIELVDQDQRVMWPGERQSLTLHIQYSSDGRFQLTLTNGVSELSVMDGNIGVILPRWEQHLRDEAGKGE